MKKIIVIILLIHNSLNHASAQWTQQISGTTSDLSCVRFINFNTGWVCGNGVILKTTNSGFNWFYCINNIPNKPYSRIFPIDSNIVYCVGFYKTIIKSTNGGMNWQIIMDGPFGQGDSYQACFFLNANTGWIAGPEYKMIKTTNGGISFDSISLPTICFNHDIFFKNSMEGLYCGECGALQKTTDGGFNWFPVNVQASLLYYFRNLTFINNTTGWSVSSSQKIFKTTDFGNNWDSLSYIPNGSFGIHYILFTSANVGYSCGEGFNVFKSTNGGINWTTQNGNGGHYLFFLNDTVGWKIANLGDIRFTTNGGENPSTIINVNLISNNFDLYQNYPNPFNPVTKIKFNIPVDPRIRGNDNGRRSPTGAFGDDNGGEVWIDKVVLKVFDILGKKIETLVNEKLNPGTYEVTLNASQYPSGVYFYRILTNGYNETKRMIVLK